MLLKRINLKKYFLITGISTLFFILLSDKSLIFIFVILSFALFTFLNQIMLAKALDELLNIPVKDVRRMDRTLSLRSRWLRASMVKGSPLLRKMRKLQRTRQGTRLGGKRRLFSSVLKRRWLRKIKAAQERKLNSNFKVKRKNWQIVGLVIGKILVLGLAIGLGVHFIGDRIILPVINYVVQILALALSVNKETQSR